MFENMSEAWRKRYLGEKNADLASGAQDQAQYNQGTGQWSGTQLADFKFDPNSSANFTQQASAFGIRTPNLQQFSQDYDKYNQQNQKGNYAPNDQPQVQATPPQMTTQSQSAAPAAPMQGLVAAAPTPTKAQSNTGAETPDAAPTFKLAQRPSALASAAVRGLSSVPAAIRGSILY